MLDIYHSRRTKYESVPYYTAKPVGVSPNRSLSEWVLTAIPAGYIHCQPVNMRQLQQNQVNNAMMFDKDSFVLVTSDECDDLSRGHIVLFRGHPWIVDQLTKELHLKESEFGEDHYDTYIYIRR